MHSVRSIPSHGWRSGRLPAVAPVERVRAVAGQLIDYTLTEPLLVVEIDTDICVEQQRGGRRGLRPDARDHRRAWCPPQDASTAAVRRPDVYLLESAMMPALGGWLAGLFEPEALPDTVGALYRAQPVTTSDPAADEAARVVADCDTKLERYRAALEASTDPAMIASWTAEVQARKAQALAMTRSASDTKRMSEREIEAVVAALGSIRSVLENAHSDDKAAVYRQLNLKLTYKPEDALVSAEVGINPKTWGYGLCPRGDVHVSHTAGVEMS